MPEDRTAPRRNVAQVDYNGRNSRRGRKPMRKQPITYYDISRKVIADVAYIKKLLNVEDKYNDSQAATAIANAATYALMNGLQLGNTSVTRNGQSIKCADFQFTATLTMAAAATTTFFRMIIFVDSASNATVPGVSDVYQDCTTVRSMRQVAYIKRFKVIYDELIALDTNNPLCVISKTFSLSHHTEFNTGNAGTIADIASGSLYLLMFSDQAVNTPTISYWGRHSFVDN
jgi:hypothetical protein